MWSSSSKLVFCFLIAVCLLSAQQVAAAETDYNWINNIYFMNDYYQLNSYRLDLPDSALELKSFSPHAQEELLNFASQFGGNTGRELNADETGYVENTFNYIISDIDIEDEDKEFLKYEPSPDVKLKADYSQEREDLKIETNTRIDLEYYMNQKTLIRAGYSLVSKEWPDIREIEDVSYENGDNNDGEKQNSRDNEDNGSSERNSADSGKPVLILNNQEKKQEGRVGISYQTSDRITISADYIREDLFSEEDRFSTIFGVEYTDDIGQLRAKYLIDSGESKETITGLELDLKDLATLSASYKILDPDLIEEQLNKQSVWDFGIDFNISDLSSVSIGYQLIDSGSEGNSFENINLKESNIEASFEIKF